MEGTLSNGFQVKTLFGGMATIQRYLAEGGQGEVYIVEYQGEKKALKWYKTVGLGSNPQAFYDNIKENVKRGAPSPEFLWPLDITEWTEGTFGYIMDLRPEGYYDVTDFMLCNVGFDSNRTVVDAALKIVSAFRILHNAGYSYQDINDGNFFIHPKTGKVLICDNDNVAPDKTETGIMGKPRYMAPEIVRGEAKPDSLTDRFSMALMLYLLFCMNHPLEGKRHIVPALTADLQDRLYGTEPLFMMDPDDDSNGPDPVVHKNTLMIWPELPKYIQEIFLEAFSQKALHKPSARPAEVAWIKALTRFRSEIVSCSCGNEIFTEQGKRQKCTKCGKETNIPFRLQLSEYSIPAIKNSRIYKCQLGPCSDKDALNPIAEVLEKQDSPGVFGIRNRSGKRWDAITSKGEARKVAADEVIPLKDGISFTVEGTTIAIKAN